ncbi:hypothetical protein BDR04DRAFT_1180201 [Suillus decipiens]|nr:hypothetical protein BDR04DRAFT_1180201 [Suillus decipiens]
MQPPDQPLLGPLFTNPLTLYQQLLTAPCTQSTGQNLQQLVVHKQIICYIVLLTSILIAATAQVVLPLGQICRAPEPYHTSALSGHEWVMKLIVGHPEHIHCELGMHVHVFESLINELHALGHTDS